MYRARASPGNALAREQSGLSEGWRTNRGATSLANRNIRVTRDAEGWRGTRKSPQIAAQHVPAVLALMIGRGSFSAPAVCFSPAPTHPPHSAQVPHIPPTSIFPCDLPPPPATVLPPTRGTQGVARRTVRPGHCYTGSFACSSLGENGKLDLNRDEGTAG